MQAVLLVQLEITFMMTCQFALASLQIMVCYILHYVLADWVFPCLHKKFNLVPFIWNIKAYGPDLYLLVFFVVEPFVEQVNRFPYEAVIGGMVGSLSMVLVVVGLCRWDPIHKRLPFDPFALFTINEEGITSLPAGSPKCYGWTHFKLQRALSWTNMKFHGLTWCNILMLSWEVEMLNLETRVFTHIYAKCCTLVFLGQWLTSILHHTDYEWDVPKGVHRFTIAELVKATGNFDKQHEIGAGGFGKVFFGTLADGKTVAIKRASSTSFQGHVEFRNEVNLLSRLHHRHLVRLEGFCEDQNLQVTPISEAWVDWYYNILHHLNRSAPILSDFLVCMFSLFSQILVYEYMKNGNLGEQIARETWNPITVLLTWCNAITLMCCISYWCIIWQVYSLL